LREPLESGEVHISRARGQMSFPARFQLVAAMNASNEAYNGGQDYYPIQCQSKVPQKTLGTFFRSNRLACGSATIAF